MAKIVYPIRLHPDTIKEIEKEAEKENRKPRNHAANIIEMYFKNKKLKD